ncbi:MAG: Rrf2 family transcriptional regulator [Planctomycetaceae bacterium]
MRLALHTDFALRTLMYLAARLGRSNIADIAQFFGVSKDHLAKVALRLSREGFIRSVRGIGGGIELARLPTEISLGEVIERFEGAMHLLDCVAVENVCRIQPSCKLKGVLQEAERLQVEYLRSVTLADVVQDDVGLVQWTQPTPSA